MASKYVPPAISVEQRGSGFILFATNHARTEIAGERLFRGEPWPVIHFSHATREAAEADAATLRSYLDACASGKVRDREVRKGWWEE